MFNLGGFDNSYYEERELIVLNKFSSESYLYQFNF